MKQFTKVLLVAALLVGGCSTLKDAAVSALTGGTNGVSASAEINNADGDIDKSVNVGTSQDVKSDTVGEVNADKQEAETIINEELSPMVVFLITFLLVLCLVFWALPEPTRLWKWWRNRNANL